MTNEEMGALADSMQRQCLQVLNGGQLTMTGAEQRTVTFSALEVMLTNVLMSTAAEKAEAMDLLIELTKRVSIHVQAIDWPKMILKRARLAQAPSVIQ